MDDFPDARLRVLHAARDAAGIAAADVPAWTARRSGTAAACVLGVALPDGRQVDWMATPHASGWLVPAPSAMPADIDDVAVRLRSFVARGFVAADAHVLARTAADGTLPVLSWDAALPPIASRRIADAAPAPGLYAIGGDAASLGRLVDAGVRTVQLRIKTPAAPDAAWRAHLASEVAQAVARCKDARATLYVNDHWRLAQECGAPGVHLGQEDLLALDAGERAALLASGLALGVSSHSPWELVRAIGLAPRYVACGPVWATVTKDMPWIPQGLDNLAWWCRRAGVPVVAIGGVLGPDHVRQATAAGAAGVCLVRGFGPDPSATVPALLAAVEQGLHDRAAAPVAPAEPHPTLPN